VLFCGKEYSEAATGDIQRRIVESRIAEMRKHAARLVKEA
jgi:hypothetical protein